MRPFYHDRNRITDSLQNSTSTISIDRFSLSRQAKLYLLSREEKNLRHINREGLTLKLSRYGPNPLVGVEIESSKREKGQDIVEESIERKKGKTKTTLLKLKKGLGVMRSVAVSHRQSMDDMMKEEE